MFKKNPRYTIIIPTFERANLLQGTIEGCLLQNYDNFEILVSNNFSNDSTEKVLANYVNHPKIRAIRTDRKLSMQDHWKFAMEHAQGDYVLFLGDDDGVSPRLFKIIDEVMERTHANIVKFRTGLYYHNDWDGIEKNTFHFPSDVSGAFFRINIDYVIRSFCNFSDYKYFPSLLTCTFKRELYLSARQIVKHMFVGAPDHSCSFLLLAQPEAKLSYIDLVLGYGGRSENSNSAFYAAKEKKLSKKTARHVEWSTEMSDETRLPHHKPDINTPGNFLPAAFSYAKYYFPDKLSFFHINSYELCKVIQRDLVNCDVGRRPEWHTASELLGFKVFMASNLSNSERKAVLALGSRYSLYGRAMLFLKTVYFRCSELLLLLGIFNIELYKVKKAERRAFDTRVELSRMGINNSSELMRNFDQLMRLPQSSNNKDQIGVRNKEVVFMGQVKN